MDFQNKSIGHSFRETCSFSPFSESNLIFFQLSEDVIRSKMALQRDLDALEARLKTEKDLRERANIQREITEVTEQIESLEDVKPPLNTLLLNGLQNNIDDIDTALEREKDIKKRSELEAKRLRCINALTARQKPVTNSSELGDAVDQIESDQRLINNLSSGRLDEVDLSLFLNSDMMPFVDSKFEGAINIAFEQMFTNDNVQSALGRTPERRFGDADQKWTEFKTGTERAIQDLEQEKTRINSQIPSTSIKERESLRQRLKEIENESRLYRSQIEEGRSDWTHRQRTVDEIADTSRSVLSSISPEVLEKLKQLLTEAQAIRTEKVQEYVDGKLGQLEKQLAEAKTRDVFSGKTLQSLEQELAEARGIIVGQRISDPKILRKLADNFEGAKRRLSSSEEEVKEVKENRPQIEAGIASDYAKFMEVLAGLTPDTIRRMTEKYRAEAAAKGISEDSAIFRKAVNALSQLSDPASDIHTKMREFGQRLAGISEIEPEELLAIKQDLELLKPRLEYLENIDDNLAEALSPENHDAQLAHKTIKELESAQNPAEVRSTLEANLGSEHLEFVTHAEFEKSYRQYSENGHMVFQEQGNKWKVIIDESVLTNAESVTELKKELTHELLHVEFEKGKAVKEEVRKALVESNPEKWEEIRAAYIEMAESKNKKPPHGNVWTDDDILSELYAMQNELGQTWSDGKTPTDKLNNLLVGAGVGAAIGDIAEKTRGYEEGAATEKIRGYESGVDEKEGGGEVAAQSQEQAVYKRNSDRIHAISDRIREIKQSEYLGEVPGAGELVNAMDGYNNSTAGLNEDLLRDPESEIISSAVTARINKVSKDLSEVEDAVSKAARKAPNNEIGLIRALWINTTFNSIEDFVQMGIDAVEFIKRRHKRNVADHAAGLGMAIFHGTDIGREALARKHKAESEEVNEWKNRYEHLDAWHLTAELKDLAHSIDPNKDQLKAIIRILASKGRLNWRNQDLWKLLNKLQTAVVLKPGDKMLLHDPVLLGQRLHRALGEVYDYDEYTSLERTQGSSYTSEKQKYDPVHNRMQDKLTDRLNELLAEFRAGERVDPILYESIIEYCIKNGKSYAENVMFHLISGMAEGILSCDRGLALGTHLNLWPAIDWFPTRQPPYSTEDWKKLCKQNFAKSFAKGTVGDDFKNWYWTEIQNSGPVIERVKKSVSERGWDHDWGRSIACLGDANTAKRFLSGRSGQEEAKVTGVQNAYVGAVQWIEENSKNPQFASKEQFARMAGWVAMSEGMLNGTAYLSEDKDINTRANEAMDRDVPREAGVGNHKTANTRQHRQMATKLLFAVDPQFFSIFNGKEARSKEQKKALGIVARDYLMQAYPELTEKIAQVESIDQIFDRIDLIITTMFSRISDAQFRAMLANLAHL